MFEAALFRDFTYFNFTADQRLEMLSPDNLVRVYRNVRSRKLKALAFHAVRGAGLRHLVVRVDTINLCNLRCKMCFYSFDYHRKMEQMDFPLFSKFAKDLFPRTRFL